VTWRLAAVRGLSCLRDRIVRIGRLCEHLAVALLSRPELVARAARGWEPFNRSPLALGSELQEWERSALEEWARPGLRVLVIGCGSGRELMALLRRGVVVDGLDIAPEAVARARARVAAAGWEATLLVAAIEDGPPLPQRYDLVLFSWFCFSYVAGREHRRRALLAATAALAPGGRIVLSYMPAADPAPSRSSRLAQALARLAGGGWMPEPGDEPLLAPGGDALWFQHLFTPLALEAELQAAGLRVERHQQLEAGGLVVARPGPDVSGATLVVDSTGLAP
jgi:SAM-dependent methyltransferase